MSETTWNALFGDHYLPPQWVVGRYRILSVLEDLCSITGDNCYLAEHVETLERVAIRELDAFSVRDERMHLVPRTSECARDFGQVLNQFLVEAEQLRRIDHPALIRVREYFEENDTAYLVADHFEGCDLSRWFEERTIPSEAVLRRILVPLLDGLDHIHCRHLWHQHLCGDAVIIDMAGRPRFHSLGGVEALRDHLISCRDPDYSSLMDSWAAPEAYFRKAVSGPWSNVYSVAAILVRGMTGQSLTALDRLVYEREGKDVTVESVLGPAVARYSPAFLHALNAAYKVDAKDRLQNAGEWLELLGERRLVSGWRPPSR